MGAVPTRSQGLLRIWRISKSKMTMYLNLIWIFLLPLIYCHLLCCGWVKLQQNDCDRNINILHIYKYKSMPQTESACDVLQHSQHNTIFCPAIDSLLVMIKGEESLISRKRLFAHHQSFLLHPAVLKPYFHLLVSQVQSV